MAKLLPILNLKTSTPNFMVYSESVRYIIVCVNIKENDMISDKIIGIATTKKNVNNN